MKERAKYNFSKLKLSKALSPLNERAYRQRWGYRQTEPVMKDFTIEEIYNIIRNGDLELQRQLSLYFYRTNSRYRSRIDFLASLPLYDTVVIPLLNNKGSKTQIINTFKEACSFVEALDLPNSLCRASKEWLKTGVYNGILRTDGKNAVIQDLPLKYCRTRFRDFYNLNVLEFNILYFEQEINEQVRAQVVETFPEEIQRAWRAWEEKTLIDPWVIIPSSSGGICFTFSDDPTPMLLASIPEMKKLDDAIKREEKRDENELYKLLIQKMPIDKDGELVFGLDEVEQIHKSVAEMLSEIDTVDVLTTFGDTTLDSLQESTAATQSADRINKYKANAYDALGSSEILFNADGSSTLAYSIKKDETIMISYLNVYETWVKFLLNYKFARAGLDFDFEILPITVFNRTDLENSKFKGAQYGYSKMFAGVALGIKQRDQISLMEFENDYLEMSDKMKPLQSSYTTPGEKNGNESSGNKDLTNKGGRPELPDEQKSEKTQANIKAAEG